MDSAIIALCNAGISLVPIPPVNGEPVKGPRVKGWNLPRGQGNPDGYSSNPDVLTSLIGYNFGLHHGSSNTMALDLDNLELSSKVFDESANVRLQDWLSDPARFEIKSPKANRGKLIFKLPAGFNAPGVKQCKKPKPDNPKAFDVVFELRCGDGAQDVVIGRHPEGGDYQYIGNPLAIPEAPQELIDMLVNWEAWKPCLDSALGIEQAPPKIAPQRHPGTNIGAGSRDPIAEFNQAFGIADILLRNGYEAVGQDRFIRPGSESGTPGATIMRNCDDGVERLFSHGGDVLNDKQAHDAFDCFRLLECGGDMAMALAWDEGITKHNQRLFMREQSLSAVGEFHAPALPGTDARDGTTTSRPLTELGNAYRLLDAHRDIIRFVYDAKAWLIWKDGAWCWDVDGATIRSLAADLHRQIYTEGASHPAECDLFAKWARSSQKENTIKAAVSLLEQLEPVRLALSLVDADSLLVGLDGGRLVLDLKTGQARPAQKADFITKSLCVDTLGQSNLAGRWLAFLSQVFGDDAELIDWLQRWCGYLLTGSTGEHCFVFCYGLGANGKSVLADTIRQLMGDYARAIAVETLTESKRQGGAATPDLYALLGARLAMCSETEDGAALAESTVKSLVSGDTISARKLYAAPIQFTPQFKLMMLGNHKPMIRGTDAGIWRRVRLLPFKRTFSPEERDTGLLDKLKAEAPHILAWMVKGCLEWQKRGLSDIPYTIKEATGDYQREQDIIGQWLADCCTLSSMSETPSWGLYNSHRVWCIDNGLRPPSNISFGRRLTERGFEHRRSNGQRIYQGLAVTDTSEFCDLV